MLRNPQIYVYVIDMILEKKDAGAFFKELI